MRRHLREELDENPVPESDALESVKLAPELGNDINAAIFVSRAAQH